MRGKTGGVGSAGAPLDAGHAVELRAAVIKDERVAQIIRVKARSGGKTVLRALFPVDQVVAHGMGDLLNRPAAFRHMVVVGGIKDVETAESADDAAGEDKQIRLFRRAAGNDLSALFKADEVVGFDQIPRRPFAVLGGVAPIVQVEKAELAVVVKGDKVGRRGSFRLVKQAIGIIFHFGFPPVAHIQSRRG